jgi:transcriptional regulator with XRE-family HTH domain
MDNTPPQNNIRAVRKAQKLTLEKVAEITGLSETYLSRIESGARPGSRSALTKIAKALGQSISALLESSPENALKPPQPITKVVQIKGDVRAGNFMPAEDLMIDTGEFIPVSNTDCPGGHEYFALNVVGNSMNLVFQEGTTLVCCPLDTYEADLVSGKYVIVRRNRNGESELTVKELLIRPNGSHSLIPRTDDVDLQGAVTIDPDDHRQFDDGGAPPIEIIAVVVWAGRKY